MLKSMPSETTSEDWRETPAITTRSLFRPLADADIADLWGDRRKGISDETLNALAAILDDDDESDRELLEACIRIAIVQAMQNRMFGPKGWSRYLNDSLLEAVDRFNRYVR
ncbi:MAG: hypothetical protein OXJ37_15165 [Bryobacterales bacterium]|nr:hypothetical protein [Bryobacterales bacterium]MDE0622082.1 hypothetical protein [Bryobacterales bacterium]